MRRTVLLLAGIVSLGGCRGEQIPTDAAMRAQLQADASQSFGASVNRDLATLREATAPFQRFDSASHAGWSAPITACMTDPGGAGGMGFHYGNVGLINGTVSVDKPQLLLYEPEQNGRLRLVAVEYIIPYTAHARSDAPPVLFGQQFKQNDTFQLWGLHVWAWKTNPSGLYADWNPQVNCNNTTDIQSMVAH